MTARQVRDAAFLVMLLLTQSVSAAEGVRQPNFIVVLMDDMGWRDVGFAGNKFVETPNIDRLAKTGLVFTQSYSSAPNCADASLLDVGPVHTETRNLHRGRSAAARRLAVAQNACRA